MYALCASCKKPFAIPEFYSNGAKHRGRKTCSSKCQVKHTSSVIRARADLQTCPVPGARKVTAWPGYWITENGDLYSIKYWRGETKPRKLAGTLGTKASTQPQLVCPICGALPANATGTVYDDLSCALRHTWKAVAGQTYVFDYGATYKYTGNPSSTASWVTP